MSKLDDIMERLGEYWAWIVEGAKDLVTWTKNKIDEIRK